MGVRGVGKLRVEFGLGVSSGEPYESLIGVIGVLSSKLGSILQVLVSLVHRVVGGVSALRGD